MGTRRDGPGKIVGGVQAQLTEKLVAILRAHPGPHFVQIIEPFRLRLSDAIARIRSGEIIDAKTICTLYTARDRLQEL